MKNKMKKKSTKHNAIRSNLEFLDLTKRSLNLDPAYSNVKKDENPIFIETELRDNNTPLVTPEEELAIANFYENNPSLKNKEESWIQTYSGKKFSFLDCKNSDIDIEDIAHALSMICRFTGHSKSFYSVAQHSVLVSLNCDKEYALQGLLHDASEAYISDLSAPLKRMHALKGYKDIESSLQKKIYKSFSIQEQEHCSVKIADLKVLSTEVKCLMSEKHPDFKLDYEPLSISIEPLSPKSAKHLFLSRYYELTTNNF